MFHSSIVCRMFVIRMMPMKRDDSKLPATKGDLRKLDFKIVATQGDVRKLDSKIVATQGDIRKLESKLESRIIATQGDLSDLRKEMSAMEYRILEQVGLLLEHTTAEIIASRSDDIVSLKSRVRRLERHAGFAQAV